MGIEITSAKAEASIIAARDRLLTIRTKLSDAADAAPEMTAIDEVLPEFDDVLKALGLAEAAIKRRHTFGSTGYYSFGEDLGTYVPDDEMHDGNGDYWGGYASPSPTAKSSPTRTP
jgi:hypothetical protein